MTKLTKKCVGSASAIVVVQVLALVLSSSSSSSSTAWAFSFPSTTMSRSRVAATPFVGVDTTTRLGAIVLPHNDDDNGDDEAERSMGGQNDRRDFLGVVAAWSVWSSVSSSVSWAKEPPKAYLEEPTEEFKESERQRTEFRAAQLKVKAQFTKRLTAIADATTERDLQTNLEELQNLIVQTEGLPLGIKKEDIVKQIRAKKAKGFWPTPVEYAYQAVIREIAYQQSPNRDKDVSNPL